MKTNRLMLFVAFAFVFVSLSLGGCKKDTETTTDTDTNQAADFALAEKTFGDVGDISDEAGMTGTVSMKNGEQGLISNCATVTLDTFAVPHTITIDFGLVNCLCNDGKYRRGMILVSFTGAYLDSASTHNITFNNYYVNDNQVLGTKTVTNLGHNTAGNLTFTIEVNGSLVLANNAGTITWISSRQREWIQGEGTPTHFDDVFLITGNASLTRLNGTTTTYSITTPLRLERSCQFRYPVSGVVEVQPTNKPLRTLDYSYLNSQCDKVATVTINGVSYNITLP